MNPFHFDGLVWHWPIAIYLFLAGMSAGAIFFAILLRYFCLGQDAWKSNFVRAACLIAPLAIWAGLGILVIDLTKPFDFWKILVFYNPLSVMSLGVMVLMVFQVFMFAWLALLFARPLTRLTASRMPFIGKFLAWLKPHEASITGLTMILSLSLGAYTGFLLSALPGYPLLNNPVLPVLFLMSGLSSGAAGALLLGVLMKGRPDSKEVKFIHKIEIPLILIELLVIFTFFAGLVLSGGAKLEAAGNALGQGFWGWIFWGGIIGLGLSLPLAMNLFMTASAQRRFSYVAFTASMSLLGVLLLRNFILYTGQMTML
ncbi:cytochrome c nitrite reductase subunit NrfD [Shewanella corallii]|uniref:Cytochrome c nitrite reductase subunit NrfD n=2 Tax=Shewanella TaxID=22 RepID=A0ABT0NBN8_9GAMM|nr:MULTISPECIES: cytochrome c nitrite reductase subunit NrfD [Shewanella]MCL1038940.1 cytochrome c nitrite reductase subunit NrfD [Shewanella submarina]MCL2915256.1 cytochrome c nitrite reductase subunit NrfD [Shewanella corallii]